MRDAKRANVAVLVCSRTEAFDQVAVLREARRPVVEVGPGRPSPSFGVKAKPESTAAEVEKQRHYLLWQCVATRPGGPKGLLVQQQKDEGCLTTTTTKLKLSPTILHCCRLSQAEVRAPRRKRSGRPQRERLSQLQLAKSRCILAASLYHSLSLSSWLSSLAISLCCSLFLPKNERGER